MGGARALIAKTWRNVIMELEESDTGRLLLSHFYKAQVSGALPPSFQFTESIDFLYQLGALDDPDSRRPFVILPKYTGAQTNCVASLNFCKSDALTSAIAYFGDIERHGTALTARPAQVIQLFSNLSSDTVDAPRNPPFFWLVVSTRLRQRMVAASHSMGAYSRS